MAPPKPKRRKTVSKEEELIKASIVSSRSRVSEYGEDYGEEPKLPDLETANEIYHYIRAREPGFKNTAGAINGRLSTIVNSKAFRNALAGFEIHDEPFHMKDENGEYIKEYDRNGNVTGVKIGRPQLSPDEAARRDYADRMIGMLQWSLTGLTDAYGAYAWESHVRGVQQSHQLAELLKRKNPYGNGTVLDALVSASKQIDKVKKQKYETKAEKQAKKQFRVSLEEEQNPISEAEKEPGKKDLRQTFFDTLYDDLYYLNDKLRFGMDLPALLPDSAVKQPDLNSIHSWQEYLEAMQASVPHGPEEKKDCLARVLVGAFQARCADAKNIPGRSAAQAKPFSEKRAENYVKQLKDSKIFKKLCESPERVQELLKKDPKQPYKQFNTLMNVFRPFGNVSPAQSREVLQRLQNMLPYMDEARWRRSSEWKELIKSIQTIDLYDPQKSGEKKLQEIYDKTCAYMKGKKRMRDSEEKQNRFDQAMDVLSVLAESGPYAKMAAEIVVDRIREVRSEYDERKADIKLKQFGAGKVATHSNRKPRLNGMEPIPEPANFLPVYDKRQADVYPIRDLNSWIAPICSKEEVTLDDLKAAVAYCVCLSKRQMYYLPGYIEDAGIRSKIMKYGRVVIDGNNLDQEAIDVMTHDPNVKALAQKLYDNPALRQELLRQPEPVPANEEEGNRLLPEEAPKPGVKFNRDKPEVILYDKNNAPNQDEIPADQRYRHAQKLRVNWAVPEEKGFDLSELNGNKVMEEYNRIAQAQRVL